MKKRILVLVMVLTSLQAMSMGRPNNLFAARKQLKAKASVSSTSSTTTSNKGWQVVGSAKQCCQVVGTMLKFGKAVL